MKMDRIRIFTWHIHGSYLFYLSQGNYDIFIPVNTEKSEGYYGRGETFPFGSNVIEVDAASVKDMQFDLILFQTDENYFKDQYEILSVEQRKLPRIYLEHDPPWEHPTNAPHPVNDPAVVLVHVTHYNKLMWDNHGLQTLVIEHGVTASNAPYRGHLNKGIVVINNLPSRGRLLGLDIFNEVRKQIPLDLVGMNTGDLGIGEVLHPQLPEFIGQYRFFFNPIRYTSLGLAVCEAMMQGMPVVGLATTEMAATIKDGFSGFVNTNVEVLTANMKYLIDNPEVALSMGKNAQHYAQERFNIARFVHDWLTCFRQTILKHHTYV
jgi:glycosyltransferase involved in cell wall biosynthesis